MDEAASKQVIQVPSTPNDPHVPTWLIFILLLCFPPAAWYFMYKDKQFHPWLPYVLWFFSTLTIIIVSFHYFVVYPQLSSLYNELHVTYSKAPYLSSIVFLISISIIFIIVRSIAKHQLNKNGAISQNILSVILFLIIIGMIVTGITVSLLIISIITPIYT